MIAELTNLLRQVQNDLLRYPHKQILIQKAIRCLFCTILLSLELENW